MLLLKLSYKGHSGLCVGLFLSSLNLGETSCCVVERPAVRTMVGLRFYPTCMSRSQLATVLWLLIEDTRLLGQSQRQFIFTAIVVARVSAFFCTSSASSSSHQWHEEGQMTPAHVVGCVTGEELGTQRTWVFFNGQYAYLLFALEETLSSMSFYGHLFVKGSLEQRAVRASVARCAELRETVVEYCLLCDIHVTQS